MTIFLSERAAQRAGLVKKAKKQSAKDSRPDIPRAPAGEGDRVDQLMRIAVYGYGPRWDNGIGFCFWQPSTGARTSAHAEYAQACVAAEQELRGR